MTSQVSRALARNLQVVNDVPADLEKSLSYYELTFFSTLRLLLNYHVRSHLSSLGDGKVLGVSCYCVEGLSVEQFKQLKDSSTVQKVLSGSQLNDFKSIFSCQKKFIELELIEDQKSNVSVVNGTVFLKTSYFKQIAATIDLQKVWEAILTAPDAEFIKDVEDPDMNKALSLYLACEDNFQYEHINYCFERFFCRAMTSFVFLGIDWYSTLMNQRAEVNADWETMLNRIGMSKAVYVRITTNSNCDSSDKRKPITSTRGLTSDSQIYTSLLKKSDLHKQYKVVDAA